MEAKQSRRPETTGNVPRSGSGGLGARRSPRDPASPFPPADSDACKKGSHRGLLCVEAWNEVVAGRSSAQEAV